MTIKKPRGNPNFVKGNNYGKGRPKKHEILKQLEELRDDVIPDAILQAIAFKDAAILSLNNIPLNQVTRNISIIARGLISERGDNDF